MAGFLTSIRTNGARLVLPIRSRTNRAPREHEAAPPPLSNVAVEDAFRLLSEGWADAALGLGWSPLDLFGAVPDPEGDPDADGLAVKLVGRRVLAICASFATVRNGENGCAYLYRGNNDGAVLLWTLGRGR